MACLALLVFFLLVAAPTFGKLQNFWNINCGGSSTIKADNGLLFEGDGAYIGTGVSAEVPSATANNLSAEISTLRGFPKTQWNKNCYRIPVEQGTKVLVRTKFYYGNYDGKNTPPEFMVLYDTSETCDVTTDSDLTDWSFCEVVYVTTKKQGTDICFFRTQPDMDPIVSSIEVSRLPDDMYNSLNFTANTLFMRERFAFGTEETIEYPDDVYNRRWRANSLDGDDGGDNIPVIVKRKSMAALNTSRLEEDPPQLLFQTAVMAPMVDNRTAGNLTIRTTWLSSEASKIYLTMYYAEMESNNRNRTFLLFQGGEPLQADLVLKAEVGLAHELSGSFDASNETKFDLVPTKGSILPPVISGMEVFYISDVSDGTYSKDVEAISNFQSNFTVLRNWSGDPCHQEEYKWEWVTCNYNSAPLRINGLKLNGYQLSGILPDFSGLDALVEIDLSNNSLTGPVPDFLASLPDLEVLNLSDNDFDSIPQSLTNDKNLKLSINGNVKLERQSASPPGQAPTASPTGGCRKLISSRVALILLLLAIVTTV